MLINVRTFFFFLCILFISFTAINCTEKNNQPAIDYSNSLIILKNASNVKYTKLNGTDQVSYKIITPYPATDTITELNNKLMIKGWKPLEKDWLNPEIPTSHVRGWTNHIDATKNPNLEVHSWMSDWANNKEDILVFSLSYRYPVKTVPNMLELNVTAIYVPEKLAKISVSQVNEYMKSLEKNKKGL